MELAIVPFEFPDSIGLFGQFQGPSHYFLKSKTKKKDIKDIHIYVLDVWTDRRDSRNSDLDDPK